MCNLIIITRRKREYLIQKLGTKFQYYIIKFSRMQFEETCTIGFHHLEWKQFLVPSMIFFTIFTRIFS